MAIYEDVRLSALQHNQERRLFVPEHSISLGTGLLRANSAPFVDMQMRVLTGDSKQDKLSLLDQSSPAHLVAEKQLRSIGLWQIPIQAADGAHSSLADIVENTGRGDTLNILKRYKLTGLQQQRAVSLVPVSESTKTPLAFFQVYLENMKDCVVMMIAEGHFPSAGKVVERGAGHVMYPSETDHADRFIELESQAGMRLENIIAHGGRVHRGVFHLLVLPIMPLQTWTKPVFKRNLDLNRRLEIPEEVLQKMGAGKGVNKMIQSQDVMRGAEVSEMVAQMSSQVANRTRAVEVIPDLSRRPGVLTVKAIAVHQDEMPRLLAEMPDELPEFN